MVTTPGPRTPWPHVTQHQRCPICARGDWCQISPDGKRARCMRVMGDHADKGGGTVYCLSGEPVDVPRRSDAPEAALAPVEVRDAVYRALAARLGLSDAHRDQLTTVRGLPPEVLAAAGFATWPGGPLVLRHRPEYQGVPGFFEHRGWVETVALPPGILVPVPEGAGRVQAFQHRTDAPGPDRPRYRWLSSRGWPQGSSPGTPVAVWCPERAAAAVWVTEGPLKGASAAHHLPDGACVLAVAGVGNWRAVPGVVAELLLSGGDVIVAYDADLATNPTVHRHREALALALHRADYRVLVAQWDGARAKGIDDALLAGLSVDVVPWRRMVGPVARPKAQLAPAPVRPLAVAVAVAVAVAMLVRPLAVPVSALVGAVR